MGRHPVNLELDGAVVLCVGGGPVAAAKVLPMVRCGAVLTVISPTCVSELAAVATWEQRTYAPGDVRRDPPVMLTVAATGVQSVDDAVAAEASRLGAWCLRIDGRGNLSLPAVIREDGLSVAVTTGAPALTRRLRQDLQDLLPASWGPASALLADLRADPAVRHALSQVQPAERRARWSRAVDVVLQSLSVTPASQPGTDVRTAIAAVLMGHGPPGDRLDSQGV